MFLLLLVWLLRTTNAATCSASCTRRITSTCVVVKTLKGRLQKLVGICNLPIVQQVQGPAIEKRSSALQSSRRSSSQNTNALISSSARIIVSGNTRLLIISLLLFVVLLGIPSALTMFTLLPPCNETKKVGANGDNDIFNLMGSSLGKSSYLVKRAIN